MDILICLRGSILNTALLGLVPFAPAAATEITQAFFSSGQLEYIGAIDDAANQPAALGMRDISALKPPGKPGSQLIRAIEKDEMEHQLKLFVEDDESISIDGHRLVDRAALLDALRAAVDRDPQVILTIASARSDNYRGIGKAIYASQRAGLPPENLRLPLNDGEMPKEND